ncbi:Na+/H+ antiporter NhaC family protein [Weissella thailandensis]|uniref:Sodium:proton antiporter n=1 Tax=Weissella thailandensis TaxID=89061 RepID=A0ABX9I507_9LACO|nr:Na+/H+ antiporter NhaC family protein [Weissella thailandensis]NKY90880.1 sodium:proton antiporter [Weissella thailandensis]RDS59617.1 sodium:proton antiporter [Weissella thailandensis]GEP74919.1 sodium:proton antiporter [Weissella thailandensis]
MNKPMTFKQSILLLLGLVFIFSGSILGLGLSPNVPLVISIITVMIFARIRRTSWEIIQEQLLKGIEKALAPLFLFLLIGMLIGLWMATNTIPSLLWVGLKIANVQWFLPSALLIMALMGTMIGSAFTTIATVGVALMGVGTAIGFDPGIVAGAVLSGAIFGDKSSPLSDSTNLASSIAGTDLFAHIKNMMWTTIPALLGSLLIFIVFNQHQIIKGSMNDLQKLADLLTPNWWSVLPIILLFIMAWRHVPAIPTLLVNITVTGIMFMLNHTPQQLADVIMNGSKTTIKNDLLAALLNRGGMLSMMPTVIIIMLALALGGLLTEQGVLKAVMTPLVKRIKTKAGMITGTLVTGISANFLIGEQYLATILPGQLWRDTYVRLKVSRLTLGRTLEDSGTVINYLVPWGVAGSFAAQTLGVSVTAFAPFTFFALLSPVCSLVSAWTGIGQLNPDDE